MRVISLAAVSLIATVVLGQNPPPAAAPKPAAAKPAAAKPAAAQPPAACRQRLLIVRESRLQSCEKV
jgi:hypothetical protein